MGQRVSSRSRSWPRQVRALSIKLCKRPAACHQRRRRQPPRRSERTLHENGQNRNNNSNKQHIGDILISTMHYNITLHDPLKVPKSAWYTLEDTGGMLGRYTEGKPGNSGQSHHHHHHHHHRCVEVYDLSHRKNQVILLLPRNPYSGNIPPTFSPPIPTLI